MKIPENKKVYFLSDVHLGTSYTTPNGTSDSSAMTLPGHKVVQRGRLPSHDVERKLCRWLDAVKKDAHAIFFLGDIFDYWFDYKEVVPRGFTRFLGKVAEVSDMGIEVHFFYWQPRYLAHRLL